MDVELRSSMAANITKKKSTDIMHFLMEAHITSGAVFKKKSESDHASTTNRH